MSLPDLYPAATWRPVSYRGNAGPFAARPIGWVLHVVVGNGSPFGTFQGATGADQRFSHLWFAKSGRVEQYRELSGKSWAQRAGNATWWSCETEGDVDEPLTSAQLDALAAWHVWCGAPDIVSLSPSQGGIGTHYMGGVAWGGHACPGPLRAGQRAEIIRRAQALRAGTNTGGPDMSAGDEVWKRPYSSTPAEKALGYGDKLLAEDRLYVAENAALSADQTLDALVAALGGIDGVKALAARLAKVDQVAADVAAIKAAIPTRWA